MRFRSLKPNKQCFQTIKRNILISKAGKIVQFKINTNRQYYWYKFKHLFQINYVKEIIQTVKNKSLQIKTQINPINKGSLKCKDYGFRTQLPGQISVNTYLETKLTNQGPINRGYKTDLSFNK